MADAVDIPVIGSVDKKYLWGGIALVAGIVGYAWWKNGTAPEDIPAYSEEDVGGYVTDIPGGAAGNAANSGGDEHDSSTTPDTDAEWTQMATQGLESSYELTAISTALGRYITGQTLSPDQETIVRAAIALVGYPPSGHLPIKTGGGAAPSALGEPEGLAVKSTTPTSITLVWDDVPGAESYRVYRSDAPENVAHSLDGLATIGGLRADTSYEFHVRALAGGKTGPSSRDLKASTSPATLGAPKGVKVKAEPNGVVWVSWSPVKGAESYRVYHDRSAQNVGGSRDTKARISGLKQGQRYVFHVRALAGGTTGPSSSHKSVKTKR